MKPTQKQSNEATLKLLQVLQTLTSVRHFSHVSDGRVHVTEQLVSDLEEAEAVAAPSS